MIYFFIRPETLTVQRFKRGKTLKSFTDPCQVAVSKNRYGLWRGHSIGNDAQADAVSNAENTFLCNPFRTRELMLEDCDIAAELVRLAIYKRVLNPLTTLIRPRVIMHLHIEPETPLRPIEKRTLKDIALRGGAREVYLCEMPTMLTAQLFAQFKPIPEQIVSANGPASKL